MSKCNKNTDLTRQQKLDCIFINALLFTPIVLFCLPTFLDDGIGPYDQSLFVANGRMFSALFGDFTNFVYSPSTWLWEYYDQYPALAVRRHPPLYAFIQGVFFSSFGSSIQTARLLHGLFLIAFVYATYALLRFFCVGKILAVSSSWIIFSTAHFAGAVCDIWLDLPCMTFAMLTLLTVVSFQPERRPHSWLCIGLVMLLTLCSLYTYLLAAPFLFSVLAFWVTRDGFRSFLTKRHICMGLVFSISLVPLLAQLLLFADDQIALVVSSEKPELFTPFIQEESSWATLLKSLWNSFPATVLFVPAIAITCSLRNTNSLAFFSAIATLSNFTFFSLIPQATDRYAAYIALPMFLGMIACFSTLSTSVACRKRANLDSRIVALVLVFLAFGLNIVLTPRSKLNPAVFGQDAIVRSIQHRAGGHPIEVLYCGVWDASFILATAMQDPLRTTKICRVDTQIKTASEFHDYMNKNKPEFIAIELGSFHEHQTTRSRIRQEILDYLEQNKHDVAADNLHPVIYRTEGTHVKELRVIELRHD